MAPNHSENDKTNPAVKPTPPRRKQRFFQWGNVNWWIAFIPGVVGAILVSTGETGLGEIAIFIAGILGILSILHSHKTGFSKTLYVIAVIFFILVFLLQVDFDRVKLNLDAELESFRKPYGTLVAANELYQGYNPCEKIRRTAPFMVHVGTTTIAFSTLPHTLVLFKEKAILSAQETTNGTMAISFDVFDLSYKNVASIDKNQYQISNQIF